MSIIGKLMKHGIGFGIAYGSATGPDSDTVVSAGSSGTITISITSPFTKARMAISKISGLPDNVEIKGWSFDGDDTLEIYVMNTGGSDVTVSANSVSVEYMLFEIPS